MKTLKQLLEESEDYLGNETHTKNFSTATAPDSLTDIQHYITDPEGDSIERYTDSAHQTLNNHHRYGPESHQKDSPSYNKFIENHTRNLDSAISKSTLKHNVHLWRGISPNALRSLQLEKGKEFTDKGYVSTSLNPRVARTFGQSTSRHDHIMHIKVKKNSKALYPDQHNLSSSEGEHEVLLPRNSKFKYHGSTDHPVNFSGIPGKLTVHHLEKIED